MDFWTDVRCKSMIRVDSVLNLRAMKSRYQSYSFVEWYTSLKYCFSQIDAVHIIWIVKVFVDDSMELKKTKCISVFYCVSIFKKLVSVKNV